jgi:signal transduction histidine kinase
MVRLIGTHTDITDQKKREEELRALNTDLENFAYIASHDLRAPLVNLKGFAREMEHSLEVVKPILERAETALSDQDKKQTQQIFERDIPESLKFIQQSVDKMDTLTNAVLNLSRIGRREFVLEAVDTHAITSRCVDGLAYEIGQKNVAVQLDALPVILSDAAAFEQIICNLLDNAVKYLEPTRKGIIKISYQIQNDEIIFSVQDNGRGIEPADRQKVFEIFRRARNAGSERGTGMGLAYVKATLRKLGGSIWFETGDVGVTFYFKLPVKSAAQPETTEPLEMAA